MSCKEKIRVRYFLIVACWSVFFSAYVQRSTQSTAILGMVKPGNVTFVNSSCIPPGSNTSTGPQVKGGPFEWDQKKQGTVLSAYFWGYFITQFPGSFLASYYGPRYVMLPCIFFGAVFSFLSVPAAKLGFYYFLASRILVGFFSGPLYPCVHHVVAIFSSPSEKTIFSTIPHTGNLMGLIVAFLSGGSLITNYENGWEYIFYLSGAVGVFSLIMALVFIYNKPAEHKLMSDLEKEYLKKQDGKHGSHRMNLKSVIEVVTTSDIYVYSFAHFGKLIIIYMHLTGLPKFLKAVYGLNSSRASYLSVIPFTAEFVCQVIYPFIVDYAITHWKVDRMRMRRLNSAIGTFGSSILLFPLGFVPCDQPFGALALAGVGMAMLTAVQAGYMTHMVESKPGFSGIYMGIANTFGSLSGVIQPAITSALVVVSEDARIGYRNSFMITAAVSFVTGMVFVFFGKDRRIVKQKENTANNYEVVDKNSKPITSKQEENIAQSMVLRVEDSTSENSPSMVKNETKA